MHAPAGDLARVPVRKVLETLLRGNGLPSRIMGNGRLNAEFFEGLTDAAFVRNGRVREAAFAQRRAVTQVVRDALNRLASELEDGPPGGLPLSHATRFAELMRGGLQRSRALKDIAGQTLSWPGPRQDAVIAQAREEVWRVILQAMQGNP